MPFRLIYLVPDARSHWAYPCDGSRCNLNEELTLEPFGTG